MDESVIKLDFSFPKPCGQLNEQNYKAKRREAWKRRQTKKGGNIKSDEAFTGKNPRSFAVKHILKDRHEELKNLLERTEHQNILTTTKLELSVKTTGGKANVHTRGNVTAHIRLFHLAVIERKPKCLEVMLNILKNDKSKLVNSILETITVLKDNLSIEKEHFHQEVFV